MLKTGKDQLQGQAFNRCLLSEYNTDITLDNYVHYFELKPIAKKIEKLRQEMELRAKHARAQQSASLSSHDGNETPMRASVVSTSAFAEILSPVFFQSPSFAQLREADVVLAEMVQQRMELHDQFFDKMHASYVKVKKYLDGLERDFMEGMATLRSMSEAELCATLPEDFICALYIKLDVIMRYRSLNLMAFRKILKKFLERCACDSIELQQRVLRIDHHIAESSIAQPVLDLRGLALEIMVIFGTVFRLTYEEVAERMSQYEARKGVNVQRILPKTDTLFFGAAFPHHEKPGSFAVRVLSGSCSTFTTKMITEILQCTRYPGHCCGRFASGEVSVELPGVVRGDDVFIVQSMVALEEQGLSNAGAFMELALMAQAAQLSGAARITAVIPYLAYVRNVASSSAVAELIESMGCQHVITVDTHNDQVEGMFSIPIETISAKYEFVRYLGEILKKEGHDFGNITIVAPCGDFIGKAKDFADAMMRYHELDSETQFVSVCTAVKRVETVKERTSNRPPHGTHHKKTNNYVFTHVSSSASDPHPSPHEPLMREGDHRSVPQLITTPAKEEGGEPSGASVSEGLGTPVLAQEYYQGSPVLPEGGNYPTVIRAGGPQGTPTVADAHTSELSDMVYHAGAGGPHGEDIIPRSSSTLAIEQALRLQESGRRAVVHQCLEVRRREEESNNIFIVGNAERRLCVILDVVIDEAVNICRVARRLAANGAERIFLIATHAVLSGQAIQRLMDAPIELIIVSDSVNQDAIMKNASIAKKLRIIPIAPLLARAIEKIHTENTLATLYEKF